MVDILYLAHNRPEFTRASLDALYKNTNWGLVNKFHTYFDDCAHDATVLDKTSPVHHVHHGKWGSPVVIMRDFLSTPSTTADAFTKIDNDLVVYPGWLDTCLATMEQFPRVDLLGIEAYGELATDSVPAPRLRVVGSDYPAAPEPPARGVQLTDHIGGIGVFRYRAFKDFVAEVQPHSKYYGFTEWQWAHPEIVKAWLAPALPVFLLDHLPLEPWRSLSKEYVRRGDQRESWGEYGPECSGLWDWWVK